MKNKEIEEFDKKQLEELLKRLKDINNFTGFKDGAFKYYLGKYEADLLLSHIEQLETDYKEANESVVWWQNRYNAIVKQNDDNHKKVVKLETNRDKAIEYVEEKGRLKYNPNELINLLKGGSDE